MHGLEDLEDREAANVGKEAAEPSGELEGIVNDVDFEDIGPPDPNVSAIVQEEDGTVLLRAVSGQRETEQVPEQRKSHEVNQGLLTVNQMVNEQGGND